MVFQFVVSGIDYLPCEIISNLMRENMYYTYILESEKDGKLYTGFTEDLKLRLEQHKLGEFESTKHIRTLKLIYYEACINRNVATRREKYLNTYYGKMFVKRMLKSYFTG